MLTYVWYYLKFRWEIALNKTLTITQSKTESTDIGFLFSLISFGKTLLLPKTLRSPFEEEVWEIKA